jgi:endonuclease/exonuclease/phosphatase family metal-dependent hydrolase
MDTGPALAAPLVAPGTLKVLTLNTHKGFTTLNRRFMLHELRDAVRGVAADLVFIQEVLGSHEQHSMRYPQWPKVPQYEFLADSIWTDFAYGRNAVYPAGHHGNAVLSKYPIVRHCNHDISLGEIERRGLLHTVVRIPLRDIELHGVCVHLSLRESHRRTQLRLLCEMLAREIPVDAPLLVAGDFNDWRMRAHAALRECARLEEAFVQTRGRAVRTFPARWPMLRLDRIYVRGLRAARTMVLSAWPWSDLSDHAALYAEIEL